MAAVNEWISREYFEARGFFVRQPVKYAVAARQKLDEEEVNLIIINPRQKNTQLSPHMIWNASDLKHVHCAMVGVRGWHTERFSPAIISNSPGIYRFAQDRVMKKIAEDIGEGPVTKILCLSGFANDQNLQTEALNLLKKEGVDGVMTFRTMLMELTAEVDVSKNYEKSDLFQIIRILKTYDLLASRQMELFEQKGRKR